MEKLRLGVYARWSQRNVCILTQSDDVRIKRSERNEHIHVKLKSDTCRKNKGWVKPLFRACIARAVQVPDLPVQLLI